MEDDWISVFITGKYYQALIAREYLGDQGIESVIVNKQDSTYLFGDVEVFVRQSDVIRAKYIIKSAGIE
jgi:hypothetical protein